MVIMGKTCMTIWQYEQQHVWQYSNPCVVLMLSENMYDNMTLYMAKHVSQAVCFTYTECMCLKMWQFVLSRVFIGVIGMVDYLVRKYVWQYDKTSGNTKN